jgi:hypothetical protein
VIRGVSYRTANRVATTRTVEKRAQQFQKALRHGHAPLWTIYWLHVKHQQSQWLICVLHRKRIKQVKRQEFALMTSKPVPPRGRSLFRQYNMVKALRKRESWRA